jgi:hypothetical protein
VYRSTLRTLLTIALLTTALVPAVVLESRGASIDLLDRPVQAPLDSTSGDPRVALKPVRFEPVNADPGRTLEFELVVSNTTGSTVQIAPVAIPLEGSTDPARFAQPGNRESRSYDATSWVAFPGFGRRQSLANDTKLTFPVLIEIPSDAAPGTVAIGIGVSQNVSALGTNAQEVPAGRVSLDGILSSVAQLRIPGDAESNARLRATQAPRIVWGSDRVEFTTLVDNVGDTDLSIDGEVRLGSFLASAGRTLADRGPNGGYPTLPGGTRKLEMRWTDPPLLGWFQPELVVVGGKGSGVRITKRLETVYVLPPWWLIVLLGIAIALPIRLARRRRRTSRATGADRSRAVRRVQERERKAEAKRRAAEHRRRR